MADQPENLVLRLLQEIRADVADVKADVGDVKAVQANHTTRLASIEETLRLHSIRLATHSANFDNIGGTMRELKEMLRRAPSNSELARDLHALEERVETLERGQ